MKLKPYQKYKDSGIEWIGEVPEGWELERFKIRFKTKKGKIPDNLDVTNGEGYLPYLSMEYLRGKEENAQFSNDSTMLKVEDGDLLLLWDGSNAGEFIFAKKGLLSSTMVKLSIERMDKSFSKYLCSAFEPMLRDLTIGMGIPHVNGDILGNIQIPIFEIEEQERITDFLDSKTSEISKTIEADKKLIELLKEKRTALINHVVTKGLNPKAKMKDSGIEWIGEVPEGWEVRKLKNSCDIKAQYGAGCEPEDNEKRLDHRYIRITDIDELGRLRKDSFAYLSKENAAGYILKEGDVLFARSGATVGKSYYYLIEDGSCAYAGYLIRYKTNKILNSKYLFYYTLSDSYSGWIKRTLVQSTIENVSAEKYNEMFLPIPSLSEQLQISQYLDKSTSKIDQTIQKIEEKIELLEEYKKSLIHHVVTGKVDVREAVV